MNIPVQATNPRASCARSCGHFRPALAAANGDPKINSRIKSNGARRLALASALRAGRALLLASPGPHCIAAAADEKARRGRARTARIPLLHMDVQLAEPGR